MTGPALNHPDVTARLRSAAEAGLARQAAHTCGCGHAITSHDLGQRVGLKIRTACSVHTGPDGHRCPCTRYKPAENIATWIAHPYGKVT
jgi:hypothetical protein